MGGKPGPSDLCWKFNLIDTTTWTTAPPLPAARASGNGITLGGRVYYFGGWTGGTTVTNTVYMYNPVDSTWTTRAPMPTACAEPAIFAYQDSLIYLVGGTVEYTWLPYTTNQVQIYNIKNNTWTTGTPFPKSRGTMVAGIIGNTAVVTTGASRDGCSAETYEGEINPSNPTQITWTLGTPYPRGCCYNATGGTFGGMVWCGQGGDELVVRPSNNVAFY